MKYIIVLCSLIFFGLKPIQEQEIELVCFKKQHANQVCHYNFKIEGEKFHFRDVGCKYKSQQEVIKKVKKGDLGLSRNWKISCPEL